MIISNKKTLHTLVFLVIYLSFFSVTINELVLSGTGYSIIYPFVLVFYALAIKHIINNTIAKSFKIYSILILLLIVIFTINFLLSKNPDSLKNIFYLLLSLSVAICLHKDSRSGQIIIKGMVPCFIVVTAIVFYKFFVEVLLGGSSIANFNHLMFFYKQECTLFYSVVISCIAYYYFEGHQKKFLVYWLLITLFCVLVGIKSILFVSACLFLAPLLFKNIKSVLFLLLCILIVSQVVYFNFPSIFEPVRPFFEYFFLAESGFDTEDYRRLETLFIRHYIISENLIAIFDSWVTIAFGTGINAVEGQIYTSEYTSLVIDAPSALESGLLFFFVYGGFFGATILLYLFIAPFILMSKDKIRIAHQSIDSSPKIYIYMLFSIFCSNVFQDNVSTLTWVVLGLGVASIVNIRSDYSNLDENHGRNLKKK
jgi:hypothetical protein